MVHVWIFKWYAQKKQLFQYARCEDALGRESIQHSRAHSQVLSSVGAAWYLQGEEIWTYMVGEGV